MKLYCNNFIFSLQTTSPITTFVFSAIPKHIPNMATPSKKLCKFGDKCHRSDCYFAHPTATVAAPTVSTKKASDRPCREGAECTRDDCRFAHPSTAAAKPDTIPFSFNPDAFVFAPQQLAEEAEPVEDEPLSNEALAELNPEFADALVRGLLDEIVEDDLHEMNMHFEAITDGCE